MSGAPSFRPDAALRPELSRKLTALLAETYPGCTHVSTPGLETATDGENLAEAAVRGLTIVTKGRDFESLVVRTGAPPKVIMVALGNCTTAEVADLLQRNVKLVGEFERRQESVLILGPLAMR